MINLKIKNGINMNVDDNFEIDKEINNMLSENEHIINDYYSYKYKKSKSLRKAEKALEDAKATFKTHGEIFQMAFSGLTYIFAGMIIGFIIVIGYRIYTNQFWDWLKNGFNDMPSYLVSNSK